MEVRSKQSSKKLISVVLITLLSSMATANTIQPIYQKLFAYKKRQMLISLLGVDLLRDLILIYPFIDALDWQL
ncbi:hypothetical protein C464_12950 [Halorubrum coriense DSM 10284]|uniref:Uncharacterized protein n=1 Tax=Halorubrum coriense DSM 10284 TaxID=1227466 RepID=M0EAW9_9EURY|nr:hypothetical protein C464_12950 [Halorubrum coriense DSM 10284]